MKYIKMVLILIYSFTAIPLRPMKESHDIATLPKGEPHLPFQEKVQGI